MHDVSIWLCTVILTGVLDVLTSFFWFKSAFIREDLPTLVLPIKATCWYKNYFGIQWHANKCYYTDRPGGSFVIKQLP